MSIAGVSSAVSSPSSIPVSKVELDLYTDCDPGETLKGTIDKIHAHVVSLQRKEAVCKFLGVVFLILALFIMLSVALHLTTIPPEYLIGAIPLACIFGKLFKKYEKQILAIVKNKDFSGVNPDWYTNILSPVRRDLERGAVFIIEGKKFTVARKELTREDYQKKAGNSLVKEENFAKFEESMEKPFNDSVDKVYNEMLMHLKAQTSNYEEFFLAMASLQQGLHSHSMREFQKDFGLETPISEPTYNRSSRIFSMKGGVVESTIEYFRTFMVEGLDSCIVSAGESILKYTTCVNIKTKKVVHYKSSRLTRKEDIEPLMSQKKCVFKVVKDTKAELEESMQSARKTYGEENVRFALSPFTKEDQERLGARFTKEGAETEFSSSTYGSSLSINVFGRGGNARNMQGRPPVTFSSRVPRE